MMSTSQIQDEVIRLQIRVSELERENNELKKSSNHALSPSAVNFMDLASAAPIPIDVPPPPPAPARLPPPPPPLMMKKLQPKVQIRKPKCKTRSLFWTKLKRPAGSQIQTRSIWDEVEKLGPTFCLDTPLCESLETEFGVLERASSNSTIDKPLTRVNSEPKFIQTLDSKRATNVSIQASGLPEGWFNAVQNVDLSLLTEEQIEQLRAAIPSKEDMAELEAAQAKWPGKELGLAERFLSQLGSINWGQELLTCWSFCLYYPEEIAVLRYRIDILRAATLELRLDSTLPSVLGLILTAGNFLNNGTARGEAYGFNFSILSGLADVKSNSKTSTLLHCLRDQIKKREILDKEELIEIIPLLSSAGRFMLTELDNTCQALASRCATCARMQEYVLARDPDSIVISAFYTKINQYSKSINELLQELQYCRHDFQELLGWLGLNVAEMSTISTLEFFELWSKFYQFIIQK